MRSTPNDDRKTIERKYPRLRIQILSPGACQTLENAQLDLRCSSTQYKLHNYRSRHKV